MKSDEWPESILPCRRNTKTSKLSYQFRVSHEMREYTVFFRGWLCEFKPFSFKMKSMIVGCENVEEATRSKLKIERSGINNLNHLFWKRKSPRIPREAWRDERKANIRVNLKLAKTKPVWGRKYIHRAARLMEITHIRTHPRKVFKYPTYVRWVQNY